MGQTPPVSFLKGPHPSSARKPSSPPVHPSPPDSSQPIFVASSSHTPVSSSRTHYLPRLVHLGPSQKSSPHLHLSHPPWASDPSPNSLVHVS